MLPIFFSSTALVTNESSTDATDFNAAEYLFVSQRIAKRLPNNAIEKLILSFKTPNHTNMWRR